MAFTRSEEYENFKKEAFANVLKRNELEMFSTIPDKYRFRLYFSISDVARIIGVNQCTVSSWVKKFRVVRYDTRSPHHPSKADKYHNGRLKKVKLNRAQVAQLMEVGKLSNIGMPRSFIEEHLQHIRRAGHSKDFYRAILVKRYNVNHPAKVHLSLQHVITENFLREDCGLEQDEARDKAKKLCNIFRERGYELIYLGLPKERFRSDRGRKRLVPAHTAENISRSQQRRIAAQQAYNEKEATI